MTTSPLASRRAAPNLTQPNPGNTPTTHRPQARQTARHAANALDLIQLHATACNGLHGALKLLTDTSTSTPDSEVFSRALARAMRATTALKQACAQASRGAA